MFFGNVTEFHGDSSDFGLEGGFGPRQRKLVKDRVPYTEEWYYQLVTCPHQGMRDWLLTDFGCAKLKENGLPCYDETRVRPNCTAWDIDGNSCEPFPVPQNKFSTLLKEFMLDPNVDSTSRKTNYDKYYREIFASEIPDLSEAQQDQVSKADFSCRIPDDRSDLVLLSISTTATLDQDFEQNYEEGIAMHNLWEKWSLQMLKFAPREMAATMQTSNGAWSYYFLNETLLDETYSNIALSLVLSFIILSVIGGNPIMAFLSVATIAMIVVDIFAFTVLMGFKLGVLEAVNYVVVIGLSIDYTVHLSEAYTESHSTDRHGRVAHMLEEMGVSVISGAISTLGAVFFMFFAPNKFFFKFACFIFATIILSCLYSLIFFPALLSIIGPTGNVGNCCFWGAKRWRQFKHKAAREYVETDEFKRRELADRVQHGEIETLVYV
jgi:predicted RND superfamily exporter protein